MNQRETNFEQNLGRLLKASCGPEVDVTPAARERLRGELAFRLPQRLQPAEFPAAALGFLTASLLLLVALWGAYRWTGRTGLAGWSPSGLMLALIFVNLVVIPAASFVVVLRRKYA